MTPNLPGGELSNRPLHFFWICDCSGSMASDGKIQSLNTAIFQSVPLMQKAAEENPNAKVMVRALRFSDGAAWHIPPTPVDQFKWIDLHADGVTDMGSAMRTIAKELEIPPMTERALPPVLVLLSDGQPTDDFAGGLNELMQKPWGKKAVRIAIAIGRDVDEFVLKQFIGNDEINVLYANNAEQLVERIKWASTAVLKAASTPPSTPKGQKENVNVPIPTPADPASTGPDVW
jgi:uncharacterized protein YegL